MTYGGFLRIGGVEVVNTERVRGYTQTSDCPKYWVPDDVRCDTLQDAIGDESYLYDNISMAPWYDQSLADLTSRFYGVVGIDIAGISDSTRNAARTEGVTSGGTIGRTRKSMRSVRVTASILARGDDALDYGSEWLSAVFDGACSQHGSACDVTDMEILAACPPERGFISEGGNLRPRTDAEYAVLVDPLRRFMHDVAVTSGPVVVEEFQSGDWVGRKVEWTITSERPWVYGVTRTLELTPALPTVIQDTPYNLMPYPSAELAAGNVVVATNLSTNPGVEVNDSGWSGSAAAVSGTDPGPFVTRGRSTDIGAGGSTASYRSRLLGNNGSTAVSAAVATVTNFQDVTLLAGTGRRISLNLWAACLILNGTGPNTAVNAVEVSYVFLDSSNVAIGSAVIFGAAANAAERGGKAYSRSQVAVPAAAAKVRVIARANITWSSSATAGQNSDVRLYADALTVSVP